MRIPFTKYFLKSYGLGFRKYIKGDWQEAKTHFEAALAIKADDKPAANLIAFMQTTDLVPPADWKGYKFFAE